MTSGGWRLATALLAALLLAACGDGGDGETAQRDTAPAVTPAAEAAPPTMTATPPTPVEAPPPAMAAVPPPVEAAPPAMAAVPPAPVEAVPPAMAAAPTAAIETTPPAVAAVPPAPVEPAPPAMAAAPLAPVEPAPPAPAEATPPAAPAPPTPVAPPATDLGDPALLARIATADPADGLLVATRCRGCHNVAVGEGTLVGPNLYGIVAAPVARTAGFAYSTAMRALGVEGATWSYDRLEAFLTSPAAAVPGTRMGFPGIPLEADRAALIAYLRTLAVEPAPLSVAGRPAADAPQIVNGLNPLAFDLLQAIRGRNTYDDNTCANCHGATLRGETGANGTGVGPPLIGEAFAAKWLQGDVYRLYRYIRTNMPPDERGGLVDDLYVAMVAFIAYENGRPARGVWLPTDRGTLEAMGFH